MRKLSYTSLVLAGALLLSPLSSHSAGLGKLTILSALGQPLSAEIDLVSVQKDEIPSLSIRLATPDAFTKANIPYSPALIGARFSIEKRADGQPYAKITSSRSVNEPFINLLVELSWARGRLLREYSALIDPPNVPEAAVAAAPMTAPEIVAPVVTEAPQVPTPIIAPGAAVAGTPPAAGAGNAKPAANVTALEKGAAQAAAKPDARQYGPVKRGDTLARIAASVKPDGVTLEQMLVGLYRNNPAAFVGNMNRLKSGQILRVPEREQLVDTTSQDALKEVRVQAADWNAYRQKLAEAAGNTPAVESSSVARGKIAAVEGKAAAKEAPKEVVKLAKGEAVAGADKSGKGTSSAKDKERLRALEDEATVREKALAEASSRIVQLEKNIKDMQRLIELKGAVPAVKPEPVAPAKADSKAAPAKGEPPKAEPVKESPKAEPPKDIAKSEPVKDSGKAEEPAKEAEKAQEPPKAAETAPAPKPKPKIVPPPPPPREPDLIEQLTTDPLYMGGGAGLLAILGVGGYLFVRRRRAKADEDDGTPPPKKKIAPVSSGAAAPMAVAPVMAQASVDDVDPLAEADLYLNFGRDTQAEEVLKDALVKNPRHEEAKLKLLQIYASRKDKDSYEKIAKDLHAQTGGAGENWIKAAGMGYALDPANALYEAGRSAPAAELPATTGVAGTDLDFDLELAPDGTATTSTRADVELDGGKTVIMRPGELAGMAADMSATQDITSDSAATRAMAQSTSGSPDFTLNLPALPGAEPATPDSTINRPAPATQTGEIAAAPGGNMIDFNFDSAAMIAPEAGASVAEKPAFSPNDTVVMPPEHQDAELPLMPNFDLDLPGAGTAAAPGEALAPAAPLLPDLKLDDISLNFNAGEAAAPAASQGGAKDDHWYDVQTKFDLAKAYQEMGDKDGAREILQEVLREGDATQKSEAKALLDSLS